MCSAMNFTLSQQDKRFSNSNNNVNGVVLSHKWTDSKALHKGLYKCTAVNENVIT
jgi:hypothetical protein